MFRALLVMFVLFLVSCNDQKQLPKTKTNSTADRDEEYLILTQGYTSFDGRQYYIFPPHVPSKWAITGDSMLRFVEDSLHIKEAYTTAKWLTYCYACADTVIYTDFAIQQYKLPQYRLFSELELVLSTVASTSRYPPSGEGFEYELSLAIKDTIAHSSRTILFDTLHNYYDEYLFYDLFFNKDPRTGISGIGNDIGHSAICNLLWITDKNRKKFAYEKTCAVKHAVKVFSNPFQPEIIKFVRENSNKMHPWFLAEAKKRGMFDSVKYTPAWVETQIAANKKKPKDCD